MIKRNPYLARFQNRYLFQEITERKKQFLEKHPTRKLISLGIGDTTEPLTPSIAAALEKAGKGLGTLSGYKGYGPEQGIDLLRAKIAKVIYGNRFQKNEVFISDGANSDLSRLQTLFGGNLSIAVQDPAYPVYVDGSLLQGVEKIHFMPTLPENQFFPELEKTPPTDLIYFCSPNNPTGEASTFEQLEALVTFAKKNRSILIFDAAYSAYVRDPNCPKSIYEIKGAEEVAIEVGSFSKSAGFTGVRLGWTVVPEALKYEDGCSVRQDWDRIVTTLFNGASILSQQGGLACLEPQGMEEIKTLTNFYLNNASILKKGLTKKGLDVYGGTNSPYLWVAFPEKSSWDVFQELLDTTGILAIPGSGFGNSGEGFLRFSAFGNRETILEATNLLQGLL